MRQAAGSLIYLTRQERVTLSILGALALAGLGVLVRQRQKPPLSIAGSPTLVHMAQWDGALQDARQVDVNTAGVAELERLPGVGPTLAQRIVAYRTAHGPFQAPEELSRVQGIGPKTYQALEDYITTK